MMEVETITKKELLQDGDVHASDEELIFNPYNSNNIEISEAQVSAILKKYNVPDKVHNINLYKRSFVHKSYCKRPHLENIANEVVMANKPHNCMRLRTKSNERLEFLGDGVLECITKYYLYRRFPKENEGFMTEKKIALVKNESIGKMAYEMGLNKWYVISNNAEEKKTRTNLKKLGCLFEAFLGALFLDFNKIDISDDGNWFKDVFVTGPGFQIAQIFVESIFDAHVDWMELLQKNDNYKNILQVMLQKKFQTTPHYKEMSEVDEDEGYHMGVYLCINREGHTIDPHHHRVKTLDHFTTDEIQKNHTFESSKNVLENIKLAWEEHQNLNIVSNNIDEQGWVVFLGESKHKIKKKAEQEACRLAVEKINNIL
jgi:dsRNA-specific ribonuclease